MHYDIPEQQPTANPNDNWQVDNYLPATPISGGPTGFRLLGTLQVLYTSPEPDGIQFGVDRESGTDGQVQYHSFAAGDNVLETIPVYGILDWDSHTKDRVRFSIGQGAPGAILHSATLDVDLDRPTIIA